MTTLEQPPGSNLTIEQPKKGYRYNQDPFHLARFVIRHHNDWSTYLSGEVLDLGCGVGVLPLLLAEPLPEARFTGIEIQEELAALARLNCQRNRLAARIKILSGDYRDLLGQPEAARKYSVVISNPPYYPPQDGRLNRCPQKSLARHEIAGKLSDLIATAAYGLRNQGIFALVLPAERLTELFVKLLERQLQPKYLQFIHPRNADRAGMLLLAARKNGAPGIIVENPIYI